MKKEFSKEIYIDDDLYKINININESSKIVITCDLKEEVLSLYSYSINLSFEEFDKLGKSFKHCNNLEDIFDFLKNIILGMELSTKKSPLIVKSNISLKKLKDNGLAMILEIPLLTGKKEDIKIEFFKLKKDPMAQFEKLKGKYKCLRKNIYKINCTWNLPKNESEFIEDLIKKIEEEK